MNAQDRPYSSANLGIAMGQIPQECAAREPGLGAIVYTSTEVANDLYLISDDLLNRLRGNPPADGAKSQGKPSSGPMKDGVDTTINLMQSTIRNLHAIGEYLFA